MTEVYSSTAATRAKEPRVSSQGFKSHQEAVDSQAEQLFVGELVDVSSPLAQTS